MGHINGAEVAKHNNKKDCWIVLDSKAYDVTSFLKEHPGGAPIILKNAGTDATEAFKKYHPLSYLNDYLSPDAFKGVVDPNTFAQLRQIKPEQSKSPSSTTETSNEVPHVSMNVVTTDFEKAAKAVLPHKSYVFASTSSNTGLALKGNLDDWSRISFRPRILRDVGEVDTRRTILGHNSPIPYYLSPMGTMGSIHPGAEPEMYKAAVQKGIHAVVSGASSKTSEQIMESFLEEQRKIGNQSASKLHFQFYIPVDRNKAIEILRTAKKAGYKGLWITVDAPVLGKRTTDRYLQAEEALAVGLEEESASEWEVGDENPTAPAVGGRAPPGQLSPHTTFKDLSWIRKEWDGPIVLKGVQCAEDAKLAMEYGCQGVLLSNHGGRQLHTAPSALMTLCEIRTYCPEVFSKLEVFVDGGLRDGNDILKALCLGATAVGVGRPFLYALGAYGAKGVEKCVDILTEELQTGMRLLGITSLDQCRPELVNATRLLNEMWRPDQFNIKSRL